MVGDRVESGALHSESRQDEVLADLTSSEWRNEAFFTPAVERVLRNTELPRLGGRGDARELVEIVACGHGQGVARYRGSGCALSGWQGGTAYGVGV